MKQFIFLPTLISLFSLSVGVFAEDITTFDGKTYQNVRISRIELDGISFMHSHGAAKVLFSDLPEPVAKKYGYDQKRFEEWRRARALAATQPQASVGTTAAAKTAEMTDAQWLEQGRALLAQRMFAEAVSWMDKPDRPIDSIVQALDRDRLLREAYASWLDVLQVTRKQWVSQLEGVQEAVAQMKKERDTTQSTLNNKRATESQVTQMSSAFQSSSSSSSTLLGRSRYFRGSGDPHAAGVINEFEINLRSLTMELNKRTPEMNQLKAQVTALDNQIAAVELRLQQLQPWYVKHWKWLTGGGVAVALLLLCVRRSPTY
ncbi:MAG: hypothetical protein WCV00_07905 [Verrucomicrobiia bacterium]